MRRLIACLLLVSASNASARQAPPLPRQAAAVKQKVDHLSPDAPISVLRVRGPEEYGKFLSNNQESFTFYDVDLKKNVTLSYAEVHKIKDGYGGYNFVQHRHTDRTKALIITAAVIGGLAILIGAAAAAQ